VTAFFIGVIVGQLWIVVMFLAVARAVNDDQ